MTNPQNRWLPFVTGALLLILSVGLPLAVALSSFVAHGTPLLPVDAAAPVALAADPLSALISASLSSAPGSALATLGTLLLLVRPLVRAEVESAVKAALVPYLVKPSEFQGRRKGFR